MRKKYISKKKCIFFPLLNPDLDNGIEKWDESGNEKKKRVEGKNEN